MKLQRAINYNGFFNNLHISLLKESAQFVQTTQNETRRLFNLVYQKLCILHIFSGTLYSYSTVSARYR